MNQSGHFVVDEDPEIANERADEEFGENDDLRQVELIVTMSPADGSQPPVTATIEID